MYHRRSRLRLNAKPDHARLMERNLVTSLLLYESIRTTRKRAKVVQPIIDRLIATAKRKNVPSAIRALNQVVTDKNASRKIMEVLVKRYATRPSGFTTLAPAGARKGDGAQLVDLSLVDGSAPEKAEAPKAAKTGKSRTKKSADSPAA